MLNKVWAIFKKDFLQERSYRLAFLLNLVGGVVTLSIYYFIDRLFGSRIAPHLEAFGVSYFSYVLVGMAFFSYTGVGLGSFAARVREEQLQGTLEFLLMTPVGVRPLLLGMGLWNFIFATIQLVFYVLVGALVFQVDFSRANLLSTLVVLAFTVVTFSSLGVLSASVIMAFKRGNPVDWLFNTLEGVFGGVYFPVTVLPPILQFVAQFLPITYAIRALQCTVYRGAGLADIQTELLALLVFSVILLPLSLAAFSAALAQSRRRGTLGQY
jgi:ABC-2 type transport system permease protein